jgi:hypothetical protein
LVALGMTVVLPAAVDYDREIRPILSEYCIACHGPDDKGRKGKLRLDQRESATHAAKSGEIAIVPGHPEKSMLISRLLTQDTDEKMPPAKEHKDLTAAQVRPTPTIGLSRNCNGRRHRRSRTPAGAAIRSTSSSSKSWSRTA